MWITRLSEDIKKPWIKENLKEIKNLINNQNFLAQDPEKGDPVTPCMGVYKAKIESDGSLDKLIFRIVDRRDIQPSVNDKCPGFFRITQETCEHKISTRHRQSDNT